MASSGCDGSRDRPHRRDRAERPGGPEGPVLIARVLIWNLFDSKTTFDELREHLPALPEGDVWIANEAQDRFGLISFDEQLPDLGDVPDLIGAEPAVVEEFDVVE